MSSPRVIPALCSHLMRIRVTLVYASLLALIAAMLLRMPPGEQHTLILNTSTNLHNLAQGRFATLIGSAFVAEPEYFYIWLPGLVALLALGELLWRSRRLVVAFTIGHIGATLIVAALIAGALRAQLVETSIADVADVGMSYGAVAVLGTLAAALPPRFRAGWTGGWLALAAASALLSGGEFTAVGHAFAMILGLAVGSRFGIAEEWTRFRCGLLIAATGFGYLMVSYGYVPPGTAVVIGAIGAGGATMLWLAVRPAQTNSSALASIQSESQASGGHSNNSPGINHS